MKKIHLILGLILVFLMTISCETEQFSETENLTPLKETLLKSINKNKKTGFDQWGYNWNAHQFNGYLINAYFGDEMNENAPWYKKEPPFDGNVSEYAQEHPEVLDYPFWIYGDMKLVMHWNESSISSDGVYQDPIVDTDAWITFHYSMGEGETSWSQFQKYVAVDSTDELVVYYEENGIPIYGEWFSDDGQSVGLFYLWKDRALIQVVNTGNVPEGILGTYKGLIGPGLGKYK
ncbi:hypothetical protein V8G61_04935 [Gaetbulibacter sp. M240]|uniref:hypothetical protein n=1 Tax=Gaetbulibacter sp. M240 TaxID=3126511 RepID=UPI00374F8F8D